MDVLIIEALEPDVMHWLQERHDVWLAPELAHDARALRQALFNVRALIMPPSVALDAHVLRYAPVLRCIGLVSAGVEHIDLEACAGAGVEVVRSATASAAAEAEFMVGALLSMLRRVPVVAPDGMRVGRELGGATVGLVGMAPAARVLAQLLGAFGSRVLGYDPALHASDALWGRWRIEPVGLISLVQRSDAVCVQLPYFSRYRGLFGERVLPVCKPDQVLVSVARSSLFDDEVLADALTSGRMSAAWLDSVEPGTLDVGRPLHDVHTLQVMPHLAGTTLESRSRSAWAVARRIDELLTMRPAARAQFKSTSAGEPPDLEDDAASA